MIVRSLAIVFFILFTINGYGQAKFAVQPKVKNTISPFPVTQVQLLDGPFKRVKTKVHQYLLSWNADSLLHWHRKAAGLEPKAGHYGGWESGGSNILGHYLTAISYMYATTGDKQLLDRVNYIVDELAACQQAAGTGAVFNGVNFKAAFDKMRAGTFEYRMVGPEFPLVNDGNYFYGIHKNIAGLRDAYLLAGNAKAKEVLVKYVDWIDDFAAAVPTAEFQHVLDVEHGGMAEVIADVYAITGNKKYAALAEKFVQRRIADPVAQGRDILYPQHANAKIPQFVGYARLYQLLGEDAATEGKSASNFWDIVLRDHTLANGGNSEYERFGPAGEISQRIGMSASETCNTYNMLKLGAELYAVTGDTKYFDYYERAMYNHLLASVDEHGMFCYYVSMKPGWFKTFSTPFQSNWCCVGSGMENPGKYEENIYAHDGQNVYVNLFIPSKLNWTERQLELKQEGRFPETDTVTMRVTRAGKPTGLRVRHPSWLAADAQVLVNGKKQAAVAENGYLVLAKPLQKGDLVQLVLPMALRVEQTPDNPNIGAVFYGPVLLAGELGEKGIEHTSFEAEDAWGLTGKPEISDIPVLVGDKSQPAKWITAVSGQPLVFTTHASDRRELTLKPFYDFTGQRYSVYWDLFSPAGWKQYNDHKTEYVSDQVLIGDSANEQAHALKQQGSETGRNHFRNFRSAQKGGWFSYDMKADRDASLFLLTTFWGGGWGLEPVGVLDIFVDDIKVATHDMGERLHQTVFYPSITEIPASIAQGKKKLTVRVEGRSDKAVSGVYDIKLVTAGGIGLKPLLKDE